LKYFDSVVCFLIAAGAGFMAAKGEAFYSGALGRRSKRQIPMPVGRLCFLVGALAMLYLGIENLQ
jgi:hypothetical protein